MMKLYKKAYTRVKQIANNLSLQKKLLLIYLVAFVIPIIAITQYSLSGMIRITNEKGYLQNQSQCNQIDANIESMLNDYYKSVLNFSNSPVVNSYFEYEYPDHAAFFSAYPKVSLHITSFLVSNPMVSDLTVYTDNPTFLKNAVSIKELTPDVVKKYEELKENYSIPPAILSDLQQDGKKLYINLYSTVAYTKNPKFHSLLYISYPEESLYSYYQHESEKLTLYLVSPAGRIFSSDDRSVLGMDKSASEIIQAIDASGIAENELTQIDNRSYYLSDFSDIDLLRGWQLYISISDESYLEDLHHLLWHNLLLICLLSLLGLLLYCLCSLSITRRLNRLVKTMTEIRTDETLDVSLETDSRDEIGVLSQNFDQMLQRIRKLIVDVYTSDLQVKNLEIENKQAQLLALQSQINPHFLFNTMQSLSISCYNNDDYETAEYINKFCLFLRDCLYWETKCVPLSEEIRVVDNYLTLQKFRYQNALEYTIDIPSEFLGIPIPKFTLQPIVENAIEHGLENRGPDAKTGLIFITAHSSEEKICIEVTDNGAGISPDTLDKLNRLMKDHKDTGSASESIGLANTNERLKLFYGSDYGLEIQSTKGKGTKVTISIPSSPAVTE